MATKLFAVYGYEGLFTFVGAADESGAVEGATYKARQLGIDLELLGDLTAVVATPAQAAELQADQ